MCEHQTIVEISGLRYCKKCNKYMGEVREINPLVADFVKEFNRRLEDGKNNNNSKRI